MTDEIFEEKGEN